LTTTDEIWKAYRQEKDGDVKERLLMIIWLKEGFSSYEVGRRLNCPHSKALYWQKRFKKKGVLGLQTMSRSGRPPEIQKEKETLIRDKLEDKNFWRTKRVSELVYNETGVIYSERHVVRLMHKWGFELITPRKEHLQAASEKEQKEFEKKTKKYWIHYQKVGI